MGGKIQKYTAWIVSLLLILCVGLPLPAKAEETRQVIRVAHGGDESFIEKGKNGVYKGYGVAYLNKIAQYTGWVYEYVENSWDGQLEDLEDGTVDLICCAQKTAERQEQFDFSTFSAGSEESVVYARPEDDSVYYQDYAHMDGKTIGMISGTYQNAQLVQRAEENGFSYQTKMYGTDAELVSALIEGEVDLILLGSLSEHGELKVVDRFGAEPYYFMTRKGNQKILEPLNKAMEEIQSESPYIQENLYQEYYKNRENSSDPLFTREEAEYIENQTEPMKIGCISGLYPMCYEDEKTGALTGIYIALLDRIQEITGLNMEYQKLPLGSEPEAFIQEGDYDFVAGVMKNQELMNHQETEFTEGFFNRVYYLVVPNGTDAYGLKNPKIALSEVFERYASITPEDFQAGEYLYKDTPEEILDAVLDQTADAAVLSTHVANYYLQMKEYQGLNMTGIYFTETQTGILYDPADANRVLVSILNKGISCLGERDMQEAASLYSSNQAYQVNLADFLTQYKEQLILGSFLFLIFVVILVAGSKRNTELRMEKVEKEAYRKRMETDVLTGLLNKEGFYRIGKEYLDSHSRENVNLVFVNVENFKLVNDLFGVQEGDCFLQYLAGLVSDSADQVGAVCSRYEADHFVILTVETMEEIRRQSGDFCERIKKYKLDIAIEISIGVYEIRNREESLRIMCDRAHLAANSIKNNHLAHLAVYEDAHRKRLIQEQLIISEMNTALEQKQFLAYFQPKYDMDNDHIIGAEALVRWIHPTRGMISPGEFIPVFEKNGFIGKLDLYIYEETCAFLKNCREKGLPLYPISVNLSRVGFYNPNLCETLCRIAAEYEIPKTCLELEITETAYVSDSKMFFQVLQKIRKEGFHILMDDFGSGYSSLNMLKEAPIDEIKLDMRFLSEEDPYGRAEKILHMIITMGLDMRLSVIAEGVETEKQKEMLQGFSCHKAQGYYYARPMRGEDYQKFLDAEKAGN